MNDHAYKMTGPELGALTRVDAGETTKQDKDHLPALERLGLIETDADRAVWSLTEKGREALAGG